MKKLLISLSAFGLFAVPAVSSVSAEKVDDPNRLDKTGQEVLESYSTPRINVSKEDSSTREITVKGAQKAASTSSNRFTLKRGSALAWSEAVVTWNYNGYGVAASDGSQDSGFIFPNIVREEGITKLGTSTYTRHEYRSETTIGAGTVTPWGDVTVYETGYTDYLNVKGDGTAYSN
ncbi:hypothetical protein ACFFGV_07585 [Pontibacillus salicampi]|uniref:Uncharacterized protein n=1 Tax=Pontibacillus salicampi TaxID=1449801 RepID=A0ABV6LMA4_9BACI